VARENFPRLGPFGWRAAQQPQRLARPDRLRARWAVAQPPPPSPVGPTCKPQASRPLFIFSLPRTRVLHSPSHKSLPRRLSLPPSPGRRRTAALHLAVPPSLLEVSPSRSLLPVPFPLRSRPRHARRGVRPSHGAALRAAMALRRGSSAPGSVRRPCPLVLHQPSAAPRCPAQPPARGWPRRGSAGWRDSAMAAGARPWRPVWPPGVLRSPPPAVGPGAGVLRAARGSGTRPPALTRRSSPSRPPAPTRCSTPSRPPPRHPAQAHPNCWRVAMAPPWRRRGAQPRPGCLRAAVAPPRLRRGAQPRPARRPARVAHPRQRPTRSARVARPRRRGVARPPGVPARLRQPARLARGGLRGAWQPVCDMFAAATRSRAQQRSAASFARSRRLFARATLKRYA
jgi:hypothetical protein